MNIKKLLGHRYEDQYTWGSFRVRKSHIFSGAWLGFKFIFCKKYSGKKLFAYVPYIDIHIDFNDKDIEWFNSDKNTRKAYGICFYDTCSLNLYFGSWDKTIYLPWMWTWKSTEYLTQDMKVVVYKETIKNRLGFFTGGSFEIEEGIKKLLSKSEPYVYHLKNGAIQHRTATYNVERRTWTWRWIPFIKKVNTSIDVSFNDEVGEKSGSWKGGTIGCSYHLLKNETPLEALKRMEKERKF